jgi:hypothetical protein
VAGFTPSRAAASAVVNRPAIILINIDNYSDRRQAGSDAAPRREARPCHGSTSST